MVIIGGGIIGCSIAYHLTQIGVTDVILLERKQLTCGTTWHAAGLVGQLRASQNMTRLAQYSTELFSSLASETGQETGYRHTGSMTLALNDERLQELSRQATMARAFGVACEVISANDAEGYWPGLNTDQVLGGVFLPGDGQTNPIDTTLALAKGAKMRGATIYEQTEVERVLVDQDQAKGVQLATGETIHAQTVILACGMWTRGLAASAGAIVPLHAAEHFYLVTEPLAGFDQTRPTLRVPDEQAYFKQDTGKLLLGAFEKTAKPWGMTGIPQDFCFDALPADFDHFEPVLNQALRRFPELEQVGIQLFFNGPESFTPDNRYLLGETPEIRQLFVAAGFNSIGIQSAGGAGKVLADWVKLGRPPMDLWDVDIRRMHPFQNESAFLEDRTTESLGLLYDLHWPSRQFKTGRNQIKSPLHDLLLSHGAVMGEVAGWERPNWYAKNGEPTSRYTYGEPIWFEACARECRAIAETVALFDQSSYPIYDITGPQSLEFLQSLCGQNIDIDHNQLVYTQLLNQHGGIEADVTILRLDASTFHLTGGCATFRRDWYHLISAAKAFDCTISHREDLATLGLMGPAATALLSQASEDTNVGALPYYQSTTTTVAGIPIRVNRLSYVGEQGFELVVNAQSLLEITERLFANGERFGLIPAGFYAMNACRMEKGYRHWGDDLNDRVNPFQAGLGFCVDLTKTAGPGEMVLENLSRDRSKRLVNIAIAQEGAPFMIGDEPIYCGDTLVGLTTSAAWGYRLQRSLAIAMVEYTGGVSSQWLREHAFTVEVAGVRWPIEIQLKGFYDPTGKKLRR